MSSNKPIIVMLDFGSASIKGIMAERDENGSVRILFNAEVPSGDSIKRGLIYNLEVSARKVQEVLNKLEKLSERKIERVYVAMNGQSLHTAERMVSLSYDVPHEIKQEDIAQLEEKLRSLDFGQYQVLKTATPKFNVNRQFSPVPVGVQAMNIDARYNVILANPKLKENILTVIENKLQLECAGFCIAPTTLANRFLSEDNKRLGCAIIDIGAGVTSVTAYKEGLLMGIAEIPLGSSNITRDLCSLHITVEEAERVKITHGSCVAEYRDKTSVEVNSGTGLGTRFISRYEINRIIEARTREIVENVKHYLFKFVKQEDIGGIVFLSGGGSMLNGIQGMLSEALKLNVTFGRSFGHIDALNKAYVSTPQFHLLYAMSFDCTADCLRAKQLTTSVPPLEPKEVVMGFEDEEEEVVLPEVQETEPPIVEESGTAINEAYSIGEEERKDTENTRGESIFKKGFKLFKDFITPPDENPIS